MENQQDQYVRRIKPYVQEEKGEFFFICCKENEEYTIKSFQLRNEKWKFIYNIQLDKDFLWT